MFIFRSFAKPRAFYDADAAGGSGGDGTQAGDQGTQNAGDPAGNQDPNAQGTQTNQKQTAKDSGADTRYQIQRYRTEAEAYKKELEAYKQRELQNKPHFDPDEDPDGSKEKNWEIDSRAQQLLDKRLKELGIEDKLSQIQYEKEENQFFEVVNTEAQKFADLGLKAPTKEQLKTVLTTLDQKGITPEQIIILSQTQDILERLKPGGFIPGTGTKAKVETPKSQAEIYEEIYKSTGAFGRGGI